LQAAETKEEFDADYADFSFEATRWRVIYADGFGRTVGEIADGFFIFGQWIDDRLWDEILVWV
jgi:hypothetical protein